MDVNQTMSRVILTVNRNVILGITRPVAQIAARKRSHRVNQRSQTIASNAPNASGLAICTTASPQLVVSSTT